MTDIAEELLAKSEGGVAEQKEKIAGYIEKPCSKLAKTKKKFDESVKRLNQYKSCQEINPTPSKK